jgi:UDP-N-acetylglucosamine 2-epimerase (non-hydrolysing)
LPVIATTHPRTRKRIAELDDSAQERAIQFLPPFGYLDYVALQQGARCVISDSGTISEESVMLGFPAITTRDSIERPEAMDTGSIIVAGATEAGLVDAVDAVLQAWDVGDRAELPADYAVRNCSQRVVNLVVSLSKLQPVWDGLHRPKRGQAR